MRKPLGRIKLIVIGTVCVICIISYLVIFRPMENALKESKRQLFIRSAEAVGYATEIFITNCINDVRGLSDGTEFKRRITEYKDGNITLDAIMEYAKQDYEDRYKTLEGAAGAIRIFEGNVIARKGSIDPTRMAMNIEFRDVTPVINHDKLSIIVYSPIKDGEEILGYDVVFFDMAEMLESVHQGHMFHQLYSEADVEGILTSDNWTELKDGEYLANEKADTWYIKRLKNTGVYFAASSPNQVIYGKLDTVLGALLFYFPLMILITILIIHTYTFGNIGRKIQGLESEMDMYRKKAHIDALTDTFTRNYFYEYFENNGFGSFRWPVAVAMIDVNNFKTINDTYGHLVGDEVLQEIAAVLKSLVCNEGMVVRYGGDEFILLLGDCSIAEAEKILEHSVQRIRNIDKFDFNIEVSYGIVEAANKEELLSGIQQADTKMYQMKRNKTAN